jgi:UDP-glucose 4-epimerase
MFPNKKILVTGGLGYIGSHTVVELAQKGLTPIIIDNLSNSNLKVLDNISELIGYKPIFYKGDVCIKKDVKKVFNEHTDIGAVIHFAAYKAVGESVQKPLMYYYNNLVSLITLLQVMEEKNCYNIVFSSSCTVYGEPDKLPVDEFSPIKQAASPYGNTKQIGEEILRDCAAANPNLQAISLRYFNPIGAHDSGKIGELPNGIPNNLVPFITQTAARLREILNVWGNDYNTPDGTCIRDYINVVDLAKAHVIAIERLLNKTNKKNFEFFNIGTGIGNSVLEIIQSFERVSGQKLNYQFANRRPGDVEKIYADTQYANKELGWKAQKTLDETILSAWKWQLNLLKKNDE